MANPLGWYSDFKCLCQLLSSDRFLWRRKLGSNNSTMLLSSVMPSTQQERFAPPKLASLHLLPEVPEVPLVSQGTLYTVSLNYCDLACFHIWKTIPACGQLFSCHKRFQNTDLSLKGCTSSNHLATHFLPLVSRMDASTHEMRQWTKLSQKGLRKSKCTTRLGSEQLNRWSGIANYLHNSDLLDRYASICSSEACSMQHPFM